MMLSRAWLALCGATTIAAQQHLADSPFINQWIGDSGYVSISTVGSDATHTTYIVKCDGSDSNVCTLPAAGATIVTGSSYVGCSYTDPSEPLSSSVGCNYIDSGASAVCTEYQSGQSGTVVATFSQSLTLPAWAVALGFNSVSVTSTVSGSKQTTEASAGNTASATTGSATATAGSLSSTGGATATGSTTKTGSAATETKTGGAAEMAGLGNARFVAAAAVLGLGLII